MMFVYAVIGAVLLHQSLSASIHGDTPATTDMLCYSLSGTLNGHCSFQSSNNTIIHTQASLRRGAHFLNSISSVACPRDCTSLCCSSPGCDMAVFSDKTGHSCYLFSCGHPSKCVFSPHDGYWCSSTLGSSLHVASPPPAVHPTSRRAELIYTQPVTEQNPELRDCKSKVILLTTDRGEIDSRDVDSSVDCQEWMIETSGNSTITLSFSYLSLGGTDDTSCLSSSYIIMGPMPYKFICGQLNSDNQLYISERNHVWIKFYKKTPTDALTYRARRGQYSFLLKYISNAVHVCHSGEFQCRNGRCIYPEWRCNGASECTDYSDEDNCHDSNFAHQLTTSARPAGSPLQASQGDVCGYNEVYCYVMVMRRYMCLHNVYTCDGNDDCRGGYDEDPDMCGDRLCNMRLEKFNGWFSSPGFPARYSNNEQCAWVIHMLAAEPHTQIQLRFTAFELQHDPDTDYLAVYDGPDATFPLLGRYYGGHVPPYTVESSSSWMYVVFHTDYAIRSSGFNATYQIKGSCLNTQLHCGNGEMDCYDRGKRCDGSWDCPLNGGDEIQCSNCHASDYSCGGETQQCFHPTERCNGVSHCSNNADEENCTPALCGPINGTFLCDNSRCIYESWTCDQHDDCGDYSDERHCFGSTKRVIVAAITGSMICGLLLVILLGCSCKLYSLRTLERHGAPRHDTHMSRLYAEFMRRIAPPPYHEAMLTSRNFDEVQQEFLERARNTERRSRRGGSHRETSRTNPANQPGDNANSDSDSRNLENITNGEIVGRDSQIASAVLEQSDADNAGVDRPASTMELVASDTDSESADSDNGIDPGNNRRDQSDDDSLLILTALSDHLHTTDGDNVSDDLCILQIGTSHFPMVTQRPSDQVSIDTATTSLDSVEAIESNIVVKHSDEESDTEHLPTSQCSSPKHEESPDVQLISQTSRYSRRPSCGSLSSSESETFSTDDVPLVVFNEH